MQKKDLPKNSTFHQNLLKAELKYGKENEAVTATLGDHV